MLQMNKISRNQKGFSLIELMVAVAILALAVFGIFQAYSAGFMGMADSKDRTEAVNYVRKALEDVKNMDFEEVGNIPRTIISGTKYEKEVIVTENIDGSPNLKKVLARVYWKDRDGNNKHEDSSMVIARMELLPGEGSRILLYVYPYNVVYPVGDSAQLTAVVKDAKGNTDIYWNKDIKISIISMSHSNLGYLNNELQEVIISPENGIAQCVFHSPVENSGLGADEVGIITIKAEVPDDPDVGYDTIDILATWGAVRIELEAYKNFSPIDPVIIDPGETIDINAYLKNAQGGTVTEGSSANVDFSLTGVGTLAEPLSRETDEGIATIIYYAGDNPGSAVVTGSATNLYSGSIEIFISGAPYAIDLNVNPDKIFTFGDSTLTITLKDVNGITVNNPNAESIDIDLSIISGSTGSGLFSENPVSIASGVSSTTVIFTPTMSGQVNIQASDSSGVLISDTATISINEPLVADHIDVRAEPSGIRVGSNETTKITAIVRDSDNKPVMNYEQPITFTTTRGSFDGSLIIQEITVYPDDENYQNGEAWVTLYASNENDSGTATITASSPGIDPGQTIVYFYVEASYILLESTRDSVNIFGKYHDSCIVNATIKDQSGLTVTDYVGEVTFSIVSGSQFGGFTTVGDTKVTAINGEASIDFRGKCAPGVVEIKAISTFGGNQISSDSEYSSNLEIIVTEGTERNISFVSLNVDANKKGLQYNINVTGGTLKIYNLYFSYNDSARIATIKIDGVPVYSGNIGNGDTVNISPTLLEPGEYQITYDFNNRLSNNVDFTTIFNAEPDCEYLNEINFGT